jgi:hypothetical protein
MGAIGGRHGEAGDVGCDQGTTASEEMALAWSKATAVHRRISAA